MWYEGGCDMIRQVSEVEVVGTVGRCVSGNFRLGVRDRIDMPTHPYPIKDTLALH